MQCLCRGRRNQGKDQAPSRIRSLEPLKRTRLSSALWSVIRRLGRFLGTRPRHLAQTPGVKKGMSPGEFAYEITALDQNQAGSRGMQGQGPRGMQGPVDGGTMGYRLLMHANLHRNWNLYNPHSCWDLNKATGDSPSKAANPQQCHNTRSCLPEYRPEEYD